MKTIPEPQRSQTINTIIKRLSDLEQQLTDIDMYGRSTALWEPCFAWRPVRTVSGNRMWLRKIYRRKQVHYDGVNVWHSYDYGTEFDILRGL